MLEHYFCLVEFKPVFEFICLNSFENLQKHFSISHTPPFFVLLCFWPNSALSPRRFSLSALSPANPPAAQLA
jgi:hypothetical protein